MRLALRGDLLDFVDDPGLDDTGGAGARLRPDHWLLVDRGAIVGVQPASEPLQGDWDRHDFRGKLVLPGFIDTHVHSST
jgi:guanine deaminase